MIGQTIKRYQILGLLGEGGMGVVYKARDITLQRDVAFKVMHPHFARRPNFRERFLREARTAAKLDHPGIVKVFDFDQAEDWLYIVMEFIPGATLRQMLDGLKAARKWIRLDEAILLVRQICLAVDYAHHQGVLHRDIKPANLMLKKGAAEGLPYRVILTDLGLAKLRDEPQITSEGASMGTPAYMSPEQALGQEIDPRSDVYSLGVLLYELAVGQLPFPVKTASDALRFHVKEIPPLPRSISPALPETLEQVILKTLEKEPAQRFANVAELADVLKTITVTPGETIAASTTFDDEVSLITEIQPEISRHRGPSILDEFGEPEDKKGDQIQVLEKDKTACTVAVKKKAIQVGRAMESDITLDDSQASREHAQITYDGTNYLVVDLNSTNGTWLGDTKLLPGVPEIWQPDVYLRIGEAHLRLRLAKQAAMPQGSRPLTTGPDIRPTFTSPGTGRVGVTITPTELLVEPGNSVSATISLFNQGSTVDHFALSISGIPNEWVSGMGQPIQIMPGDRNEIVITISPPRTSSSRAGYHPINLTITSTEEQNESVELKAPLTVAAFSQFDVELHPQRGHVGKPAQVIVRNQGNAKETFTVQFQDRADELEFQTSQAQIHVPEGGSAIVEFRANLRQQRWIGREKSHSITVYVSHSSREPQTLSGEVISRGLIPGWLPPVITILCLLMIAGGTILRPIFSPTPMPTSPGQPIIDEWCVYPADNPPVTFSDCPIQVRVDQGQDIIIRWSVRNATNVEISPIGGFQKNFSDQITYPPEHDVTITLKVSNIDNLVQKTTEIIVTPLTSTPTFTPTTTQTSTPDLVSTETYLAQTHLAETAKAETAMAPQLIDFGVIDIRIEEGKKVICIIKNMGNVEIEKQGNIWVDIYLNEPQRIAHIDISSGEQFPLEAGEELSVSVVIQTQALESIHTFPHDAKLSCKLDPVNQIIETNEENNLLVINALPIFRFATDYQSWGIIGITNCNNFSLEQISQWNSPICNGESGGCWISPTTLFGQENSGFFRWDGIRICGWQLP